MTTRTTLLYFALLATALLAVLHLVAMELYFYWTVWWFDNLIHFLAGLAGGMTALWAFYNSGIFFKHSPRLWEIIIISLSCIFVVGVAWEYFEFVYGLTEVDASHYISDTFLDLTMDLLGSVVASIIGMKVILKM